MERRFCWGTAVSQGKTSMGNVGEVSCILLGLGEVSCILLGLGEDLRCQTLTTYVTKFV